MRYDPSSNFWLGSKLPDSSSSVDASPLVKHAVQSGCAERGMLWHGSVGNGKTTAMLAAFKQIKTPDFSKIAVMSSPFSQFLDRRVIWTQSIEFCKDVNAQIDFAKKYSDAKPSRWAASVAANIPCLFFDDLGAEKSSDHNADTIAELIDARYRASLPTWFTTNLNLDELASRYGARSVSRLASICEFVAVSGVDRRMAKYQIRAV